MPKVSVITIPYHKVHLIEPVFDAIFGQTHKDIEVLAVINDSRDGSMELIREKYPAVKIIESGYNAGFSEGNNIGIRSANGEFIQLVNDDLLLEPDYIEKMLQAFADPKVGAATGKLLRYDFMTKSKTKIIDSTGIVMGSSGRAKDRGQLEEDRGQYDRETSVFGVSGAGPMYRKSALERIRYCDSGRCEYFDSDFFMYWEDVDLSWRLNRLGYRNVYVPEALAFHGRTAGQSKGGYLHLWHFVRHHKTIPAFIRRLNYRNHILMYLKNRRFPHPVFLLREKLMFLYLLLFEPSTLKVIPELFRLIPGARAKFWDLEKRKPA
ncbi:MAG: glycosyltransferase family 2 protein [Candidatus Saccharibacteria bacterium]